LDHRTGTHEKFSFGLVLAFFVISERFGGVLLSLDLLDELAIVLESFGYLVFSFREVWWRRE